MTDIERIKELAEAATPGPWETDTIDSDGCYGSGDLGREGYKTYALFDASGRQIADALNSEGEVHEEYDEDGTHAWDDVARRNFAFIAAANPATISRMVAEIERLRAREAQREAMASEYAEVLNEVERLREALRPFAEEAERYDPPENDDLKTAWDTEITIGDLRRARSAMEGK